MNKLKKDGTPSRQGEGSRGRRPLKWSSVEELQEYIDEYYEWANDNKMNITVSGLAWWLGCSRTTLLNYEMAEENDWLSRLDGDTRKGYVNTIKDAKRYIEMNYENNLFYKGSVTGAIFTLKNNYGWVDKQEVINTNKKEIEVDIIED